MLILLLATCFVDPTPIIPAKLDRKTAVDYAVEVKPILQAKCIVCHAGKITEGDYDLSTPAAAITGGKRGPAIVPGKPDESLFLTFSAHRKKPIMPPKTEDNPLTPTEVALLERWIAEGAKGSNEIVKASVALRAPSIKPVRAVAIDPKKQYVLIARGNIVSRFAMPKGDAGPILDPTIKDASGKVIPGSHVSLVESMAISPDGRILATGSFREVTLWDLTTGQVTHRIGGFAHTVVAMAFSNDGKRLATGGGVPTEDGEVKIIDLSTGRVTLELKQPHTDTVYGVAWNPDGTRLATASADKTAKLFDTKSGQFVANFEGHTHHVLDVSWSPDGKRFASGGADGVVKIWDVEKGEKVRDIPGFGKQVTRMTANPTAMFVAAGDGTVKSINRETGGINRTFTVSPGYLAAVACTANGEWLLAGSDDGTVKLFDVKTGQMIREWTK